LETHANRFLPERTVGKYVNTAYKVAWDQLCSAVLFNVGYVASVSLGKGENMEECAERIQEQVPSQMILHWKFWPAFHFFNFLYVPLDYRVVAMNVIKVAWSGLLSYRIQGASSDAKRVRTTVSASAHGVPTITKAATKAAVA